MLKIAICDDTPKDLQTIVAMTKEYISSNHLDAEVAEFSHPDTLLMACEHESFHIFLLDMVMPMLSGLELGLNIRKFSSDAQIIFITTEPGFALDAYAVNPLHYLLKPVNKDSLFNVLVLASEKVDYGDEKVVTVKTRDGLYTLLFNNIICCEYVRHTAIYTLVSGERIETSTISGSFAEHVAPLLSDRKFIQPHAAFVVNMSRVEKLNKNGFTLRGGASVPVSGKQYVTVRNTYMSYRLGEV